MSTLRKQENEKITKERENKMTGFKRIIKRPCPSELELQNPNYQICEHCLGTGVNQKYGEVNKIINAILDYTLRKKRTYYVIESPVPFCIYCLGDGFIRRNQNNNEKNKKEILAKMQSKENEKHGSIVDFLIYVANCETIYDCDKETAMHYDILDDSWKEYNGSYNMQEAKLNLVNYMREFRTDGYLDITVNSAKDYFYEKNVIKRWIGLETDINLDICWCCHRRYTELKRFWSPGDPEDGDFTGPYLSRFYRPLGQVDKKAVKVFKEAYKLNKNDIDATEKWLIKKYGNEIAEEIRSNEVRGFISESWECRDCGHISNDEYIENQTVDETAYRKDWSQFELSPLRHNQAYLNLRYRHPRRNPE